jgi:hypothetical protein
MGKKYFQKNKRNDMESFNNFFSTTLHSLDSKLLYTLQNKNSWVIIFTKKICDFIIHWRLGIIIIALSW